MLLNRVLTVRPGAPASHRGQGWEHVTAQAIRALVDRGGPLVAVLWGRDARQLRPHLGDVPIVESAHPSPLSAHRGFFGSRPFSRANALLEQQGTRPTGLGPARLTTSVGRVGVAEGGIATLRIPGSSGACCRRAGALHAARFHPPGVRRRTHRRGCRDRRETHRRETSPHATRARHDTDVTPLEKS